METAYLPESVPQLVHNIQFDDNVDLELTDTANLAIIASVMYARHIERNRQKVLELVGLFRDLRAQKQRLASLRSGLDEANNDYDTPDTRIEGISYTQEDIDALLYLHPGILAAALAQFPELSTIIAEGA